MFYIKYFTNLHLMFSRIFIVLHLLELSQQVSLQSDDSNTQTIYHRIRSAQSAIFNKIEFYRAAPECSHYNLLDTKNSIEDLRIRSHKMSSYEEVSKIIDQSKKEIIQAYNTSTPQDNALLYSTDDCNASIIHKISKKNIIFELIFL